jgi:hypothetical protein
MVDADPATVYHLITDLATRDHDAANAEHIKLTLQRLKEQAEAG